MSFIAKYVYTYEEFVFMTEAPQCNRMTKTYNKKEQVNKRDNNIQIDNYVQVYYNRQFCLYMYSMCN